MMDVKERARLRALCEAADDPVRVLRSDLADVLDALDAAEARATERERERDAAQELAYIGDHRFPDLTWKARCDEASMDLRRAECERAAVRSALGALADESTEAAARRVVDDNGRLRAALVTLRRHIDGEPVHSDTLYWAQKIAAEVS